MLSAQNSAESQIGSVPDDLDGHVRAVGPVTQIFGEDLLAVVDGEAKRDERHRKGFIISDSRPPTPCRGQHRCSNRGCRSRCPAI